MELAERRARLEEEAARKLAEKEMKPKKPRPTPKTDWVVSCIKGMKIAQEKTWYQVIFLYLVPSPFAMIDFLLGEVGWLAKNYVGAGGEFAGMSRGHRQFPCGRED